MPARRRALLATLCLLAGAAPASAADIVPGEVVVGRPGSIVPRVVRVAGDPARAAARLRARPGVSYAVPNVRARAAAAPYFPRDPGTARRPRGWIATQWNFLGGDGFGVDAPRAWANVAAAGHPGARGVTIAVLDTGVAYHDQGRFRRSPDLRHTHFVHGYDFVDRDPFAEDHTGHGTHVASTLAEDTGNDVAVTGLAYGATIMPVRVLDSQGEGDATVIAAGVRFAAAHGAKIINLSLEFSTQIRAKEIPQLLAALRYARGRGVLVVGASGNEARATLAYPARSAQVLSVAATTEHGCLSDFSNDGAGLDLVGPGGGADAQLDDPHCHPFEAPGRDIFQMTFSGTSPRRFGLPSGYEGTSMAVPHVAGTAALVIASGVIGRDPSPAALEAQLKRTARDLGPTGPDRRYGAGLVDAGAATATATSSG